MQRIRQVPRIIRPYLTTSEVMDIAEVTRRTLRHYTDKGIIAPFNGDGDDYYDRWTFDQTVDLQLIQTLRAGNVPLDDIAAYTNAGEEDLLDAAYRQSVDGIRHNRRMLKAIVHRKRQIERFAAIGQRDGYYIRYLPQRWMALVPASEGSSGLVDLDTYTERFIGLKELIEIVGWSQTFSAGTLMSLSSRFKESTGYVFLELASPPMPYVTEGMLVDGGCYHVVDDSFCDQCGASCVECARFGRHPSPDEQSLWKRAEVGGKVIDRSIITSELAESYATGMWADYTQHVVDRAPAPPTNAHRRAARNNDTSPTVRPRLMPQTVRLPLGVTACVLPAGMYLCRQNDYVDRDDTMQRLLGALSVVPQRTITREDEIRIAKAANAYEQQHRPDQQREPGPFMEPFAVPRDHGDPTLFDFVQPLEDRDLPKLTLPVGMALAPEDGCVILHTDVPAARAHGKARQELQVLIDAQNVSPPPRSLSASRASRRRGLPRRTYAVSPSSSSIVAAGRRVLRTGFSTSSSSSNSSVLLWMSNLR